MPMHMGALGIRRACDVNLVLLGKLIWNLLHDRGKLWVEILSHKYLRNSSVLDGVYSSSCSPIWSAICKAAGILK